MRVLEQFGLEQNTILGPQYIAELQSAGQMHSCAPSNGLSWLDNETK